MNRYSNKPTTWDYNYMVFLAVCLWIVWAFTG